MRWLLALVAVLAACGGGADDVDYAEPRTAPVASLPGVPWPALDVLVMIDDSSSDELAETYFPRAFPEILDALEAAAGTTDLHFGVITSDMGTSGGPAIGQLGNGGCAGVGKDGALVTSGATVTGDFLVDVPGMQNFTGNRSDAIGQMLRPGFGGCGFEQPVAAIGRAFTNPANAGFFRSTANLLIIAAEDEDDCSVSDPALFEADTSRFGPLESFRCTRYGVTCDEPMTDIGPKHHCQSNEESPYLRPMQVFADALRARVADPSRLAFGLVAGPNAPFETALGAPPDGGEPIERLNNVCFHAGGTEVPSFAANPAVRMADLVDDLRPSAARNAVCDEGLAAAAADIARVAKQMYGIACLDTSTLRDSDTAPGIQPMCYATEERDGASAELPACPADGDCVEVIADPTACAETADHLRLNVRYATPPTAATYVRARCEIP